MKTIILTIGLLISLISCKKKDSIEPDKEATTQQVTPRNDALYRDLTFNLTADSVEILVNNIKILPMTDLVMEFDGSIYRQDTFINYIGTKQFYPGDRITINTKGLSMYYNNGYSYSIYCCYTGVNGWTYNQQGQNYYPNGVIMPYQSNSLTFIVE